MKAGLSPFFAIRSVSHFCCSSSDGKVALPARIRAASMACHSKILKVRPAPTYWIVSLRKHENGYLAQAYRSDEKQRGVLLIYHMLVHTRYPIVSDFNARQERQTPRVSCAEDDMVDVFDKAPIDEMHRSLTIIRHDTRDTRFSADTRIVECTISEIHVYRTTVHDRMNRRLCHTQQIRRDVCRRDRATYKDHPL